jgi:molybdate transport system ATP-binding protein
VLPVRLAAIEPHGDVMRLRAGVAAGGPAWADGLAADVTPAAVADLAVEPGAELWFVVKATEVGIHAASS